MKGQKKELWRSWRWYVSSQLCQKICGQQNTDGLGWLVNKQQLTRSLAEQSWWYQLNGKGGVCRGAQPSLALHTSEHTLPHVNSCWTGCSWSYFTCSTQRTFGTDLGWVKTKLCSCKIVNTSLVDCKTSLHYHVGVKSAFDGDITERGTRAKKGFLRWSELKNWQPNFKEIKSLAKEILLEWADTSAAEKMKEAGDDWQAHDIYYIWDALLFCEFKQAVVHADPGCILQNMRYWCLSFRGASQHNYARECAEVLLKWKYELDEMLRKALEQAWFVNWWGLLRRWIPANLMLNS